MSKTSFVTEKPALREEMEFDKQIYDNVGDYHSTKDKNYEIVNVCTREIDNEYEQMELKVPHKNSLIASDKSTIDSGKDVNKSGKATKRQCVAVILIFAFLFITVAAITLSVVNYVAIQSIKGQSKLEENASREHTSAIQTLMQVTHNLNTQFNATLEATAEVQNDTYSHTTQLYSTLKARLDETQNSTEELNNDLRSLSMQVTHNLNAQFNATQEGVSQLQNDIYSFVSQQFTTLTSTLNKTKNSTDELKSDVRFLKSQLNDLSSTINETMNMREALTTRLNLLQYQFNTTVERVEQIYTYLERQQNFSACGLGLWQRVAYLNMSDPFHQCPPVWREYSANGVRACGRPANAPDFSCYSMHYSSTSIGSYTKVCGQVIGYQIGSTDVFANQQNSINTGYVDGVSITYGVPRTHIWTYAAGLSDAVAPGNERFSCPCLVAGTGYTQQTPPSFVGNNYYCESGNPTNTWEHTNTLTYTNDPLWDGQNCEGRCCSDGRTPPWFSVQLTGTTTSDIEVRICGTEGTINEDTPIKLLELYVQ